MGVAASRAVAARMRVALGGGAELLAVADGFGRIDGVPVANAALQRLRQSVERRVRGEKVVRSLERSETAATFLAGEIARLNETLHARSASHQDYVSAGCSLTAALVVRRHVVVAHVGATAAYLTCGERVRTLTPQHVADDLPVRLLTRALGIDQRVDVTIATFDADEGDTLVLTDARDRRVVERRFDGGESAVLPVAPRRGYFALACAAAAALLLIAFLCIR